jgi:hypothetical protein
MVFGFMAGKDGAKVPVALLVGRAQYVSIRPFSLLLPEGSEEKEEHETDLTQLLRRPQHGPCHVRNSYLSAA